jgi:hypothetical protein
MNYQNNNSKSQKLYLVNGEYINVTKLRQLILNAIGNERVTSTQIAERINAKYHSIRSAISSMVAYRFLNSSGSKSHTIYFVNNPCLLQDIFHPMPNFDGKIKSVYTHTEDKDKHNNFRMQHAESFNASALYYLED